ncbi:MAG: hypothetical protein ABI467_10240 [Kofleriaceae bacterium]
MTTQPCDTCIVDKEPTHGAYTNHSPAGRELEVDLLSSLDISVAACRGALTGLMNEIIEGHVRAQILAPAERPTAAQRLASEQLLEIIKAFLK